MHACGMPAACLWHAYGSSGPAGSERASGGQVSASRSGRTWHAAQTLDAARVRDFVDPAAALAVDEVVGGFQVHVDEPLVVDALEAAHHLRHRAYRQGMPCRLASSYATSYALTSARFCLADR